MALKRDVQQNTALQEELTILRKYDGMLKVCLSTQIIYINLVELKSLLTLNLTRSITESENWLWSSIICILSTTSRISSMVKYSFLKQDRWGQILSAATTASESSF